MESIRWEHLLSDGILKDNQIYSVKQDRVIKSLPDNNTDVVLCELGRYYKKSHVEKLYHFLIKVSKEIDCHLKNKNENLVLFNSKEYEHNTEDNICTVVGYSPYDFQIHTSNIVGCIKFENQRLTISSRYGNRFLRYIIADTDGFLEIKDKGTYNYDNDFEWLLIYLWRVKLMKAYRLGIPKLYTTKDEFLPKMKGFVDLVHYELNKDLAKYHCKYQENSYNNPTNQLIAAVFNKYHNNDFLFDCKNIKDAFITAVNGMFPRNYRHFSTIKHFTNPYYSDYNVVIDLSKRLMKDESLGLGDNKTSSGFLFDMSMLFEYFIRKQIANTGVTILRKFGEELTISTCGLKQQRKLEPDLIFQQNDATFIFDVKYKHYDIVNGIKREDLFQLHTYIGQYANKFDNISACGFIYPIKEERYNGFKENHPKLFANEHIILDRIILAKKDIPFYVLFLEIPEDDDNFTLEFHKKCFDFQNDIKMIVNDSINKRTSYFSNRIALN